MDHLALPAPKTKRRRHSPAFKEKVIQASNEPGASIASVAQAYGVNANLLHKWRRARRALGRGDFVPLRVPSDIRSQVPSGVDTVRMELPGGVVVHWPLCRVDESVSWLKAILTP